MDAYIVNVHPILSQDEKIMWDVYYLTEGNIVPKILRIYNISLSFVIARLPGFTYERFEKLIKHLTRKWNDQIQFTKRTDLRDSSYFNFDYQREYLQIYSKYPFVLADVYKKLSNDFKTTYSRIKQQYSKLTPEDQLFFDNTETPFRYTSTFVNLDGGPSLSSTIYFLSTKYDVPLIGGVILNRDLLEECEVEMFPEDYIPQNYERIGLDAGRDMDLNISPEANERIYKMFKKNENIDMKNLMRLVSYDIETYSVGGIFPSAHVSTDYIFCIGLGVFDLLNPTPLERYCLISRDMKFSFLEDTNHLKHLQHIYSNEYVSQNIQEEIESKEYSSSSDEDEENINTAEDVIDEDDDMAVNKENELTNIDDLINPFVVKSNETIFTGQYKRKCYKVKNEYLIDPVSENTKDYTTYIICESEKDILKIYFKLIRTIKPQIITGFNTFGFDDNYMFVRSKLHNIENEFLQLFTPYDLNEMSKILWFKPFTPRFKTVKLKIDNEIFKNNTTVVSPFMLSSDVHKIMLKEDPKRFTQHGRGNLNTMLKVYKIKNPYTNMSLSKTDLSIQRMLKLWDNNDSDVYPIALYCVQDAWITGTLLITRAKLIDLIELAQVTYTNIYDSLFKADGGRIANTILAYAYKRNFALMDTPHSDREHYIKHPDDYALLGGKTFDDRTIVGGWVRLRKAGKHWFVVALDYASMYPSQKEGSNIDSSSRVDERIINNPTLYGLTQIDHVNISDMFGNRDIYYFKKKDNNEHESLNTFVVESFYAEYNLNVKELKNIIRQYEHLKTQPEKDSLMKQFKMLYQEFKGEELNSKIDIPDTVMKKVYFGQSPRREDGLPSIHYSLKEEMLSDYRANRGRVKKLMAEAERNGDKLLQIRYNAKQNQIKVCMNVEYGASGSSHFAHYDSDIASAVTFASRQLIGFLTHNLEKHMILVDKEFMNENSSLISNLTSIECLDPKHFMSIHEQLCIEESPEEFIFRNRKSALRRIYDTTTVEGYINSVYVIFIKPSTVVYQDTDSNYYINDHIREYYVGDYEKISPDIIDKCMHSMLDHNNFMASFAASAVKRRPVGLSFEGAFIVCRYLNRKKKYYGIKWGDDDELRLSANVKNPLAYTDTGILIDDYSEYWNPKESVVPLPNGNYINLDMNKLREDGVNYFDYIRSQNVKCTGVDLARRDQYKFINFFHMVVLQTDLRIMKYETNNQWSIISKNETIVNIVEDIFMKFRDSINAYIEMTQHANDPEYLTKISKPPVEFNIEDFARNAAYRPDKQNNLIKIVNRLRSQGKEKYIPEVNTRASYVVILDNETRRERASGKYDLGGIAKRSYLIDELIDDTESEDITSELISKLDFAYYFKCLCNALALYAVGDVYPNEIAAIDSGELSTKESNKLITKLKDQIAKKYMDQYFPNMINKKQLTRISNEVKTYRMGLSKKSDILCQVYDLKEINVSDKLRIIEDATRECKRYKQLHDLLVKIYTHNSTNKLLKFPAKNEVEMKYYKMYRTSESINKLLMEIEQLKKYFFKYKYILKKANELIF